MWLVRLTKSDDPTNLSAAACREQATNCRKVAEQVMTPAHRIMLEHIAETWDRIAANIDEQRYLPEEIDFDKEAAN